MGGRGENRVPTPLPVRPRLHVRPPAPSDPLRRRCPVRPAAPSTRRPSTRACPSTVRPVRRRLSDCPTCPTCPTCPPVRLPTCPTVRTVRPVRPAPPSDPACPVFCFARAVRGLPLLGGAGMSSTAKKYCCNNDFKLESLKDHAETSVPGKSR